MIKKYKVYNEMKLLVVFPSALVKYLQISITNLLQLCTLVALQNPNIARVLLIILQKREVEKLTKRPVRQKHKLSQYASKM